MRRTDLKASLLNKLHFNNLPTAHDALARMSDVLGAWKARAVDAHEMAVLWCGSPEDGSEATLKISFATVNLLESGPAKWGPDSLWTTNWDADPKAFHKFTSEPVVHFDATFEAQTATVTFGIVPTKPDEHPEGLCRCPSCSAPSEDSNDGISPPPAPTTPPPSPGRRTPRRGRPRPTPSPSP